MQQSGNRDVWQQLAAHHEELNSGSLHILDLFVREAGRAERYTLQCEKLRVDLSRHLMTTETWTLLSRLARNSQLQQHIQALFDGEEVNTTEQRPALHVALRGHSPHKLPEASREVAAILERMSTLVNAVHQGHWTGHSGQTITDVVNIGIGGSDLGPAMACAALRPWHHPGLAVHFVSNVDPAHLRSCLDPLKAETTLFIVSSKSFGTLETLQNATAARQWCLDNGVAENQLHQHFVAVSANVGAAVDFGIDASNVYPIWDWVGGRYSLWSAIGLSIALATSMACFRSLLDGAHAMDEHFRTAQAQDNIPLALGLLAVWYRNLCQASSHAVLPYAQDLHLLPSYLQQLEMESLGKSVDASGAPLPRHSGPIIWGSAGSNGQHSFHQLLHQGTQLIPVDFIGVVKSAQAGHKVQHQHLLANCLSQSQALMCGKSLAQATAELTAKGLPEKRVNALAPHLVVPGNRPSTVILMDELTPFNLGSLVAMYEHKVFVQSVIWRLNAFDQWGVEIGKQLSRGIFDALSAPNQTLSDFDPSTQALIRHCHQIQEDSEPGP